MNCKKRKRLTDLNKIEFNRQLREPFQESHSRRVLVLSGILATNIFFCGYLILTYADYIKVRSKCQSLGNFIVFFGHFLQVLFKSTRIYRELEKSVSGIFQIFRNANLVIFNSKFLAKNVCEKYIIYALIITYHRTFFRFMLEQKTLD